MTIWLHYYSVVVCEAKWMLEHSLHDNNKVAGLMHHSTQLVLL